mmetsp:Transcript_63011/g.162835  ORF Transcript_63011/g.162835 Transcript_63011/m.162835 type:complete len:428 (+) Transcript_63011:750-2033(+)
MACGVVRCEIDLDISAAPVSNVLHSLTALADERPDLKLVQLEHLEPRRVHASRPFWLRLGHEILQPIWDIGRVTFLIPLGPLASLAVAAILELKGRRTLRRLRCRAPRAIRRRLEVVGVTLGARPISGLEVGVLPGWHGLRGNRAVVAAAPAVPVPIPISVALLFALPLPVPLLFLFFFLFLFLFSIPVSILIPVSVAPISAATGPSASASAFAAAPLLADTSSSPTSAPLPAVALLPASAPLPAGTLLSPAAAALAVLATTPVFVFLLVTIGVLAPTSVLVFFLGAIGILTATSGSGALGFLLVFLLVFVFFLFFVFVFGLFLVLVFFLILVFTPLLLFLFVATSTAILFFLLLFVFLFLFLFLLLPFLRALLLLGLAGRLLACSIGCIATQSNIQHVVNLVGSLLLLLLRTILRSRDGLRRRRLL